MKLLHTKISELFLHTDMDFLKFPKHKTGWGKGGGRGVRYTGQGIFTPAIYHRLSDNVNKKGILAKFFTNKVNLTEITLLITQVIVMKDKIDFENNLVGGGGRGGRGGGKISYLGYHPRGSKYPG